MTHFHIVKTEFDNMLDVAIEIYKCPKCGRDFGINGQKWITGEFVRFTCFSCATHIFVVSKNCDLRKIENDVLYLNNDCSDERVEEEQCQAN